MQNVSILTVCVCGGEREAGAGGLLMPVAAKFTGTFLMLIQYVRNLSLSGRYANMPQTFLKLL